MRIPFYKAQAVGIDFLFTWVDTLPEPLKTKAEAEFLGTGVQKPGDSPDDLAKAARDLCHRNLGVGADGWYLMHPAREADVEIHLFNSDGSRAELSGNGTRCAAAVLTWEGCVMAPEGGVRVKTGSGVKRLTRAGRTDNGFLFEMEMGTPHLEPGALHTRLPLASGAREAAVLNVGNPQCALAVPSLDFDWRSLGAEIEGHSMFPARTNVSFFRATGPGRIEARFYERGAGPTLSSGTGSTGAAAAAILLGMAEPELEVITEAGPMKLRWESAPEGAIYLEGPAEVVARGEFFRKEN